MSANNKKHLKVKLKAKAKATQKAKAKPKLKVKPQAKSAKRLKKKVNRIDPLLETTRSARFNQLLAKLEDTRKKLENERDVALQIAGKVLDKVKQVRQSLQNAVKQVTRSRSKKQNKANNAKSII